MYSTYECQQIVYHFNQGHKTSTISRLLHAEGLATSRKGIHKFLTKYIYLQTVSIQGFLVQEHHLRSRQRLRPQDPYHFALTSCRRAVSQSEGDIQVSHEVHVSPDSVNTRLPGSERPSKITAEVKPSWKIRCRRTTRLYYCVLSISLYFEHDVIA